MKWTINSYKFHGTCMIKAHRKLFDWNLFFRRELLGDLPWNLFIIKPYSDPAQVWEARPKISRIGEQNSAEIISIHEIRSVKRTIFERSHFQREIRSNVRIRARSRTRTTFPTDITIKFAQANERRTFPRKRIIHLSMFKSNTMPNP